MNVLSTWLALFLLAPPPSHPTLPASNVTWPDAEDVAKLYGAVGRELITLESTSGIEATIDLWPRYRWIRVNDAMSTPEKRMQATVMLQRLQRDIHAK